MALIKNKRHHVGLVIVIFLSIFSLSSCSVLFDTLVVKIRDSSKCELKRYNFDMPEMTISFSPAQIKEMAGEQWELVLDIPAPHGVFKYKMRAEYENCPEIVSEEMEAKRGYVIYEIIENNKIEHAIRAKGP